MRREWSDEDVGWMKRALALAARGRGRVEPNPMVGAVIVRRGRVVGEGYHRRFGGPHAEVEALRSAGGAAAGGDLYVTLEPCNHSGKTPPCTEAVLAAGIGRVIAAMEDPHGIVAGRGFRRLRRAGIEVDVGLCGSEARSLNAPFIQLVTRGMPFVTAKWASTLDGRIAAPAGGLHWITGDAARRHVHRERGLADAILVGIGTVLADDPRLTCRVPGGRNPRRIILDSRARLPLQSRLVQTVAESDVLVVTTAAAPARRVRSLERAGCRILTVPAAGGRCSLRALLRRLGQDQITHLLVEGGQAVLSGFFREGLVDRVLVYLGPKLIGAGAPPLSDLGIERMGDALELRDIRTRRFGDDLLIEGVVRREARRAKR